MENYKLFVDNLVLNSTLIKLNISYDIHFMNAKICDSEIPTNVFFSPFSNDYVIKIGNWMKKHPTLKTCIFMQSMILCNNIDNNRNA